MIEWFVSPRIQVRIHAVAALIWLALVPISIAYGWLATIVFTGACSLYANFATHISGYQAARAGKDVVEAIVEDDRIPTK